MNKLDITTIKCIYFLGIGGIGMSALARYFKAQGIIVRGYDKTPSPLTQTLVDEGITINFNDQGEAIAKDLPSKEQMLVVYTPAVPASMGEFVFFQSNGYKILKRAEVLGLITQSSKGLCVAGTHGKTTTSTMLAHIMQVSSLKCNAFLGGISSNYETNYLADASSVYTVIEADEFDRSFLKLSPFASIITTTDPDHLDIYGDKENFQKGFEEYATLIDPMGCLVVRKGIQLTTKAPVCTYSVIEEADYFASNIHYRDGQQWMDVHFQGKTWKYVGLGLPGIHNAENALACIALADFLGINENVIREALESFKGVKRRFDVHVRKENLVYIDDYAHHPTEIHALLNSVKKMYPELPITTIFQPHLFSRTNDFMEEFAHELAVSDTIILLPIYPARELPIPNVTSEKLASLMNNSSIQVVDKQNVLEYVSTIEKGVILTVGAGDIDRLVIPIKEMLLSRNNEL